MMMHRGGTGRVGGGASGTSAGPCSTFFSWTPAHRRQVLLAAACSLAVGVMLFSLLSPTSRKPNQQQQVRVAINPNPRQLADIPHVLSQLLTDSQPNAASWGPLPSAMESADGGSGAPRKVLPLATATAATAATAAAGADSDVTARAVGGGDSGGTAPRNVDLGTGGAIGSPSSGGGSSGSSGSSGGGVKGGGAEVAKWDDVTGHLSGGYLHLDRLGLFLEASLRQQVFCEEAFPLLKLEAEADSEAEAEAEVGTADGGSFTSGTRVAARQLGPGVFIYVYAAEDEVSRGIRDGIGWENDLLREILWALAQPLPYHVTAARQRPAKATEAELVSEPPVRRALRAQETSLTLADVTAGGDVAAAFFLDRAIMAKPGESNQRPDQVPAAAAAESAGTDSAALAAADGPYPPLFVDVGANVGWFAIRAAAKGYRVAAFEGMATNVGLMRSSICASPVLKRRLQLFSFGLGSEESTCFLFSDVNNRGDGITMCDVSTEAEAAARVPRGYALRGRLPLRRLDSVLRPHAVDIKVLKVDVEGYEPNVIAGMGDLRAWYIATEFNPVLLASINVAYRPAKFLEDLLARGYRLSTTSFRGPWLTEAQVRRLSVAVKHPVSVYGAHEDLFVVRAAH